MAGVFDKISAALAGKKTAPATSPGKTKFGNTDVSNLRRGQMVAPPGQSGIDTALSQHADEMHPVKQKVRADMGEIEG